MSISKLLGFSKSCFLYTVMSPEPWRHRALGQSSRSHHCTHHVLVLWLVLDDEVFVFVVENSEFARKTQQGDATDTTRRRARHRATSSSWSTHGRSESDHANERRNTVVNVTQQELSYQKCIEQHKKHIQLILKHTYHLTYKNEQSKCFQITMLSLFWTWHSRRKRRHSMSSDDKSP